MLRIRWTGVAVLAACAVCFATLRASAADEPAKPATPPRGERFMQGGGALRLLQQDVVAGDLSLTDEQKASLKTIAEDSRKQMTDLRDSLKDASRDERRQKMADVGKEITKKADAVLNDKQRARLKEIELQIRGPNALQDPEIADALKLTDEQKQKLTDLSKARRDAFDAARKDAGSDRSAVREKLAPIMKDSNEKMEAVLTAEQKEQLEKMEGKKLDLGSLRFGSFGGPGRRANNSDSK